MVCWDRTATPHNPHTLQYINIWRTEKGKTIKSLSWVFSLSPILLHLILVLLHVPNLVYDTRDNNIRSYVFVNVLFFFSLFFLLCRMMQGVTFSLSLSLPPRFVAPPLRGRERDGWHAGAVICGANTVRMTLLCTVSAKCTIIMNASS